MSRRALPMLILAVVLFLLGHVAQPLWMVLALHLSSFFAACLVCHGELALDRPSAGQLTDYYLMMCLGGMIGGLFNALLAPILFSVAAEYPIGLTLAALLCPRRAPDGTDANRRVRFSGRGSNDIGHSIRVRQGGPYEDSSESYPLPCKQGRGQGEGRLTSLVIRRTAPHPNPLPRVRGRGSRRRDARLSILAPLAEHRTVETGMGYSASRCCRADRMARAGNPE